jgi:23S rRNA A2030 N6-methylase RlmJ
VNLQQNNVGNLGDILKHAALGALARLFSNAGAVAVNYLDTHAYLLRARLANPDWHAQTRRLRAEDAAYRSYVDLEAPWVARGDYLCSAGIIHSLAPHAHLYLSESDPATRAILANQIADHGIEGVTILDGAALWCTAPPSAPRGSLLALVDPFRLTETDWEAALCGLERLHHRRADGLLEVFAFDSLVTELDWPPPPEGWLGPVARLDRAPYHLAVYANGPIRHVARATLERLGFKA